MIVYVLCKSSMMKTTFRLYNSLHSSIFDLIEGNGETQQTKGLSLVLSKSEKAIKAFLNLKAIEEKIGKIDWQKVDDVLINAEFISTSGKQYRADIVIRLYADRKPYKMIMIEAKSLNKNTAAETAAAQVKNYLSTTTFKECGEFGTEVYGFTLTKYPAYSKDQHIGMIVWSDVIKLFYSLDKSQDLLLNDYFQFITKINGAMQFYEKEVFSIPTADWSSEAINKFYLYECPNAGRYQIKYKPLYLTFRKSGGGEMDKLYKVDQIILLNFNKDYQTFLQDDVNYSEATRQKVRGYVDYMQSTKNWSELLPNDEKQVLILSEQTIELKHKPKPRANNSFRAYYTLFDLLNCDKKILDQNSQEEVETIQ